MHKHVEILIGRLATDPNALSHFARHPHAVIGDMGLELTEVEIAALIAINIDALRMFSATLDARLRKASHAIENRTENQTTHTEF